MKFYTYFSMNLCLALQIINEKIDVWVLFVVCMINEVGLSNTLGMVANRLSNLSLIVR